MISPVGFNQQPAKKNVNFGMALRIEFDKKDLHKLEDIAKAVAGSDSFKIINKIDKGDNFFKKGNYLSIMYDDGIDNFINETSVKNMHPDYYFTRVASLEGEKKAANIIKDGYNLNDKTRIKLDIKKEGPYLRRYLNIKDKPPEQKDIINKLNKLKHTVYPN